jgi:hypothetical protein
MSQVCDICQTRPATKPAWSFYKLHKLYLVDHFMVCAYHTYTDAFDSIYTYYDGEWVKYEGEVWWWPLTWDEKLMPDRYIAEEYFDVNDCVEGLPVKRQQLFDPPYPGRCTKEEFLELSNADRKAFRRTIETEVSSMPVIPITGDALKAVWRLVFRGV